MVGEALLDQGLRRQAGGEGEFQNKVGRAASECEFSAKRVGVNGFVAKKELSLCIVITISHRPASSVYRLVARGQSDRLSAARALL